MSEYTLDILEAMESLKRGKCDEIKSEDGHSWAYNSFTDTLLSTCGYSLTIDILETIKRMLGKWRLVGVKPRTEQRTIKYWLVVWKDGSTPNIYYQYPDWAEIKVISQQVIPLSHTYTYTFPAESNIHPVMGKILNDFEKGDCV